MIAWLLAFGLYGFDARGRVTTIVLITAFLAALIYNYLGELIGINSYVGPIVKHLLATLSSL